MSDIHRLDLPSSSIGVTILRSIRDNPCAITYKSFFIEFFKFILYSIFGIGVYVMLFSSQKVIIKNSFHESIITNGGNSGKIFDKNIRGIFPPLIDEVSWLINRWQIVLDGEERISPYTNQTIEDIVTLEFEWDGKIHVFRSGCPESLRLAFHTKFSNIFISEDIKPDALPPFSPYLNMSEEETQQRLNRIKQHSEDMLCVRGPPQNNIIKRLIQSSIWTVYRDNLFFLVERASKASNETIGTNQMIVFDRKR